VKKFKIKSYCKINLSLKIIKKLNNGYHRIFSFITFCNLCDVISITKIYKSDDKIIFSGKFKKGINKKFNTVTKLLNLLRKKKFLNKQKYQIHIKKNIPHGSGLGGGSSNAANLLSFFNSKMKLRLSNNKLYHLANEIGSDVPVSLVKKNTFLTGKKNEILRINKKLRLNLLIVYPNLICSTKIVYKKNKIINSKRGKYLSKVKNNKQLIEYLEKEDNDLEKTVIKIYPRVKKIIQYIKSQKGCYFSRITGSGSACIGIFSNMENANYARRLIKLKYPSYWCVVSKTI
jgi:4-diphosphocytidyl-2-C-methyl-D-erythritol kinase